MEHAGFHLLGPAFFVPTSQDGRLESITNDSLDFEQVLLYIVWGRMVMVLL
jgi:hypothetical protein